MHSLIHFCMVPLGYCILNESPLYFSVTQAPKCWLIGDGTSAVLVADVVFHFGFLAFLVEGLSTLKELLLLIPFRREGWYLIFLFPTSYMWIFFNNMWIFFCLCLSPPLCGSLHVPWIFVICLVQYSYVYIYFWIGIPAVLFIGLFRVSDFIYTLQMLSYP